MVGEQSRGEYGKAKRGSHFEYGSHGPVVPVTHLWRGFEGHLYTEIWLDQISGSSGELEEKQARQRKDRKIIISSRPSQPEGQQLRWQLVLDLRRAYDLLPCGL